MIFTVTLNPSVDISYKLAEFKLDQANRVTDVSKTAGGKGLNVSRVLKQLNQEVAATGFLGGSLGTFIRDELSALDVTDHFIDIKAPTRNCIAVIHDGNQQSEILESGPEILTDEANRFLVEFESAVQSSKWIAISGSLPKGLADNFYNQLLTIAKKYHVPVLLDTGGSLLEKALKQQDKPFLIKPNESEIADLLEQSIEDENQLIEALKKPLFSDVEWVVITLGSNGALIKHQKRIYRATIPKVDAVNPVGSGDSVIAGMAAGLANGLLGADLIRYGLAMGVLNAMEEKTGQIDPSKIDWCKDQVKVEEY